MYNHQQVMGLASKSTANLPLPLPLPLPLLETQPRRPYDEESRVSTDSDLDLTDFDDEDGDGDGDGERDDGYRNDDDEVQEDGKEKRDDNRSTFSGVLMRRLRVLEEQQQPPPLIIANVDNNVDQPGELIRPPLLAVADDSFSAKMRRVLKWTHSLPPSDTVSESSESSVCSPATVPTAMLLPIITPLTQQSRKRRLSDALFPDDDDEVADTTQQLHMHHHQSHHHYHHMLKRPRIADIIFTPSAPGSPFFSSAPRRLYPFPVSTPPPPVVTPPLAPPAPASAPILASAVADHDHKSRRPVPQSCDSLIHTTCLPPMADLNANNATADATATLLINNRPISRNPIGIVEKDMNVNLNVVVPVQSQLPLIPPSAQLGMPLFNDNGNSNSSSNNCNIHICAACGGSSFSPCSCLCFNWQWHTSSTPPVSYAT